MGPSPSVVLIGGNANPYIMGIPCHGKMKSTSVGARLGKNKAYVHKSQRENLECLVNPNSRHS